jgi:putative ABC transport system permease protein
MGRANESQGGASKLVALKVVDAGYPLRGSLRVAPAPETPGKPPAISLRRRGLGRRTLLDALGLKMGDPLLLGDSALRIARIIVTEPDRGGGFMSFAPRVMINQADIQATALVQPASRLSYRFAVAGTDRQVRAFNQQWADAEIKKAEVRGVRLESLEAAAPRCARRWTGPKNS